MSGNDLQIYVGAKLICEGIDPRLFNRIKSEHCYGPNDGPFLFRGHLVVPARLGVPSCQDLEAAGYQFPNRGRYPNHRGAGPRSDIGLRGGGPYGRGGTSLEWSCLLIMIMRIGVHVVIPSFLQKVGILRFPIHRRESCRESLQPRLTVIHGIRSWNLGKRQNLQNPESQTWFGLGSKERPVPKSN